MAKQQPNPATTPAEVTYPKLTLQGFCVNLLQFEAAVGFDHLINNLRRASKESEGHITALSRLKRYNSYGPVILDNEITIARRLAAETMAEFKAAPEAEKLRAVKLANAAGIPALTSDPSESWIVANFWAFRDWMDKQGGKPASTTAAKPKAALGTSWFDEA